MLKNLPKNKQEELDIAFKASKNIKEANRIQAIRLLSKGRNHKDVSEVTGYSEVQIQQLVTKYNKKDITGLKLKPHPKNNSKLSITQKNKIKTLISSNQTPNDAGLKLSDPDNFWSIESLKALVKNQFHMEYKNLSSYRKLFKYCGFSYQKVEFEDERKSNEVSDSFKKRLDTKIKGGRLSMWW